MALSSQQINAGSFLATTSVFDPSAIYSVEINSDEFKEFLFLLASAVNNISLSMNTRDAGYYSLSEFLNGQIFFPNPTLVSTSNQQPVWRQVYREVVNFGTLPNAGTKSVVHNIPNINAAFSFTRIYGAASDPVGFNYIPLPYASPTLVNNIELSVDATNVNITTGSNRSNFTITYVILEYIKQ